MSQGFITPLPSLSTCHVSHLGLDMSRVLLAIFTRIWGGRVYHPCFRDENCETLGLRKISEQWGVGRRSGGRMESGGSWGTENQELHASCCHKDHRTGTTLSLHPLTYPLTHLFIGQIVTVSSRDGGTNETPSLLLTAELRV